MSKVLSVYLPKWPVRPAMRELRRASRDSCRRDAGQAAESATAVLLAVGARGSHWVACACERAEAKGVCVGMSLAHAKALLRGTRVWERPFAPIEDAARLHRLARWAQRFSPVVVADEPDGLLLDLAGCERLLGGDEHMVSLVDASFARWALPVRLALAPTVGCAWAAARFAVDRITLVGPDRIREELAPLPIAGLRIDPAFVEALQEVGIERIGSLFDLPRHELACRFGADLLRRLDQATGETIETITPLRPSAPLEVARVFDGPVLHLEAVTITVRELLFSLVLQLEERGCGVRTLEVVCSRIAAEPCRCSLALTHPSRDVQHLWTLLRPKIEGIHLGYGVESVSLHAARFGLLAARQSCFGYAAQAPGDTGNEAVFGEFVDRLMDRLGTKAVCTIEPVQTYVPEEAFPLRGVSSKDGASAAKGARRDSRVIDSRTIETNSSEPRGLRPVGPWPSEARESRWCENPFSRPSRPSQLFTDPERAEVISLVPDGPPSWMRWRGHEGAVRCGLGPERLALPWWVSKRGGPPSPDAARDYYEVEDDQGRLLWVFRNRVSREWFVHGVWA